MEIQTDNINGNREKPRVQVGVRNSLLHRVGSVVVFRKQFVLAGSMTS